MKNNSITGNDCWHEEVWRDEDLEIALAASRV